MSVPFCRAAARADDLITMTSLSSDPSLSLPPLLGHRVEHVNLVTTGLHMEISSLSVNQQQQHLEN
jgi:hypothetical protein